MNNQQESDSNAAPADGPAAGDLCSNDTSAGVLRVLSTQIRPSDKRVVAIIGVIGNAKDPHDDDELGALV